MKFLHWTDNYRQENIASASASEIFSRLWLSKACDLQPLLTLSGYLVLHCGHKLSQVLIISQTESLSSVIMIAIELHHKTHRDMRLLNHYCAFFAHFVGSTDQLAEIDNNNYECTNKEDWPSANYHQRCQMNFKIHACHGVPSRLSNITGAEFKFPQKCLSSYM